ncbi:hypothetical protein Pelo_16845 [Pelomyxa schiedti]|nr:hypothetical protein Pelo_16845 [Pelomyxa schiedti]
MARSLSLWAVVVATVFLVSQSGAIDEDVVPNLELFRSMFYSYATHMREMSKEEIDSFILFPTQDLIYTLDYSNLNMVQLVYNDGLPSDLSTEAAKHVPTLMSLDELRAPLYKQAAPITIVTLPGMLGEFIPHFQFDALFSNTSTLYKQWIEAYESTSLPKEDMVYDLYALADISMPLTELFDISSIDDENGTPLFRIIAFKIHEGSLETLGAVNSTTERWNRRLTLVFNILQPYLGDIFVTGYSLTGVNSIEIPRYALQNGDWWASKMRGVITFAGVNWGTHVADCAIGEDFSEPPLLCLSSTVEISELMRLSTLLIPDIDSFVYNTAIIAESLAVIAFAAEHSPEIPEMANLTMMFPDLYQTWTQILEDFLFHTFDIQHPVSDYAGNIIRFQQLVAALYDAVVALSTNGRADYWTNTITPTEDFTYYFLSDTQQDPTVNVGPVCHTDTYMLRQQYYQLEMMEGGYLNDAQVSSPRAMFLPYLHQKYNPQQPLYSPVWLGVTSSTHWGIALEYVFPDPDDWHDPFPRDVLFNSVASFIAQDL